MNLVNIGFIVFDILLKLSLIKNSQDIHVDPDAKDCPYISLLRQEAYYRMLKSVSQAFNFFEHQLFIVGFNLFIFKL